MELNREIVTRLEGAEARYNELHELMAQPEVATDPTRLRQLAKEQSGLEELVSVFRTYRVTTRQLADAKAMLDETTDEEMRELAKEEADQLAEKQDQLADHLKRLLLPKDPNDEKDVIVEIRAGAGGDEAGLFAADLFRMYTRYAESKGWHVEVISSSESGIGGFKEIIFEIKGRGAYSRLKYESGVHRVQRVPATEASGRIHTSTATVAVLPEVDEYELEINPSDLRTDVFHAGGHGGQNVNKVATAIRLTHVPSGLVVVCMDQRSQLQNRTKAMQVLRTRLMAMEQEKQDQAIGQARRAQVGTGDRAEKSRTYNFPENRISDKRINVNFHNLPQVLNGDLDPLIDAVATTEEARLLEAQPA